MTDKRADTASADEAQLVAGLRAGERASYEQLVRAHGGRMLAVARRLLGDEDDARDCVQEAFLQAFRNIGSFQERASLGTWLHRIVVNAGLMRLRARERRAEDSLEDLLPRFDENGMRTEAPGASAPDATEAPLEDAELAGRVRRAISRLPEGYRDVLLLRDIEGYSTEETAELLGMTPGSVKTRLHRARAALKALLESTLRGRTS